MNPSTQPSAAPVLPTPTPDRLQYLQFERNVAVDPEEWDNSADGDELKELIAARAALLSVNR